MGDSQFIGVALQSFVGGSKAVVDLYVRLANDHYIKIVSKGDEFDLARLGSYQNKEVNQLYIMRDDYALFTQHSAKVSEIVATRSPATTRQKIAMILRTADHVFTEIADLGVSPQCLNHAVQVCQSTISVVENNPSLLDVLDELSKYSQDFARHSLGTSVLAVMMVQSLKWHGRKTLHIASLGGLLHDIGMREMSPALLTKPRVDMTPDEIAMFQSHPLRGVLLLQQMPGIPPEVLGVVGEHHEMPSGAGFPRGIKGEKIFPLSRAVAFADALAELVLKSDANPEPRTLKDALNYLSYTMRHDFPAIYFDAARRLINSEAQKKVA